MSLGMLAELMPNPVQLCPTTSTWIAPRLAKNIHGECAREGGGVGRRVEVGGRRGERKDRHVGK